jgi:uncharacterized protein (TIGR02453 family)
MPTATSTFRGFRREAITFLAELAAHNDRAWFTPRKAEFERLLKEPMEALCVALAERLDARGIPLLADPKRSPFRIYRDTRFSRDKSPYKTNLGASFPWVEPAGSGAGAAAADMRGTGAYVNVEPGEMVTGGGRWMPDKPWLEAFRRTVLEEPGRVRAAIEDPAFRETFGSLSSEGDQLKRLPPGLPADHELADLFRYRHVVFGRRLSDDEVLSPSLPDLLVDAWAAAVPVFRLLAAIRPD